MRSKRSQSFGGGETLYERNAVESVVQFENSIIVWKDVEMIPTESIKESRKEARLGLERCAEEIRKRFSELLVV